MKSGPVPCDTCSSRNSHVEVTVKPPKLSLLGRQRARRALRSHGRHVDRRRRGVPPEPRPQEERNEAARQVHRRRRRGAAPLPQGPLRQAQSRRRRRRPRRPRRVHEGQLRRVVAQGRVERRGPRGNFHVTSRGPSKAVQGDTGRPTFETEDERRSIARGTPVSLGDRGRAQDHPLGQPGSLVEEGLDRSRPGTTMPSTFSTSRNASGAGPRAGASIVLELSRVV